MADEGTQPGGKPELPYVRETVLKKRKSNADWGVKRRERRLVAKKQKLAELQSAIRRPEDFVKEFRSKELDAVRIKRRLKIRGKRPEDAYSKLLFVIRINGSKDISPRAKTVLNKLRLWHRLNGVFLRANESILKMLLIVEPLITYGYPSSKSVRDLIFKKGCGMVNKKRIPFTNNEEIEKALGQYNIICVEDIVTEICNLGPHFNEVTRFLLPFELKCPERRMNISKKLFKDGGDAGNRKDQINDFIAKLN